MAKFFLYAVAFLLLTTALTYAQPAIPRDVNALYRQLEKTGADTARVRILVDMSRYYNAAAGNNSVLLDSAFATAYRADRLAAKLVYTEGIGLSYQALAQAWCKKKDFTKSDELIKKAIAEFLSHNLSRDAAEAYLNMEEFYIAAGGKDYNVMIHYYEQALLLFIKTQAMLRAGDTLAVLGDFYMQVDKNEKAITTLERALALYKSAGKKDLQSLYDLLGVNYMMLNNFKESLKNALLAIKTAEDLKDSSMVLCTVYNRAGMMYFSSYQYERANIYYNKAMLIAQKYNDKSEVFLASNIASSLLHLNGSAKAIELLKATEKRFPDISEDYRIYYKSIYLKAYFSLRRYQEAERYADELLKAYLKQQNDDNTTVRILGALIPYYTETKQYASAAKYLPVFFNLTKKAPVGKRFILSAYLSAYQVDSARHNYASAITNYKNYTVLKDSLSEATKNKQMQELQVAYETEKKEKENLSLKKESLIQADRAKKADHIRDLTLIGSVFLLVIVIVLYWGYRVNQKNSKAISEKNNALNRLITEKEWLLKEIHHRVKNNLQIVMGLLQRQSSYIDNEDALAAIQNSENRMHSIALIHQKLYQSENLDLICMPEYVNEMITYLKDSSGLDNRIFFEKQIDDIYLDVTQAVPLGLILNEAITNAIKYAYPIDATGIIYISMIKAGGQNIELTIADNGPGLSVDFDINKVDSLGVNLMKGLTKQLGGSFDITNNDGCTVNICFKAETFKRDLSGTQLTLT